MININQERKGNMKEGKYKARVRVVFEYEMEVTSPSLKEARLFVKDEMKENSVYRETILKETHKVLKLTKRR